MYVFKPIDPNDSGVEEQLTHTEVNLSQTVDSTANQAYSASFNDSSTKSYSDEGHKWNFLHHNFYSSGSSQLSASNPTAYESMGSPWNSLDWEYTFQGQYRNKFYESASLIAVPQHYYGERIKPGSVEITATTMSKTITIKDDSKGNLYAYSGAEHSQSSDTAISSSENYIGNVFYNNGIITFTETGSWSGSSTIGQHFTYLNLIDKKTSTYDLKFQSSHKVFRRTWLVRVEPNEFNSTLNMSARGFYSGSAHLGQENYFDGGYWWPPGYLTGQLSTNLQSGSGGWPVCTAIALYGEDTGAASGEPLVVAHLTQPIPMDNETPLIFELTLDF